MPACCGKLGGLFTGVTRGNGRGKRRPAGRKAVGLRKPALSALRELLMTHAASQVDSSGNEGGQQPEASRLGHGRRRAAVGLEFRHPVMIEAKALIVESDAYAGRIYG